MIATRELLKIQPQAYGCLQRWLQDPAVLDDGHEHMYLMRNQSIDNSGAVVGNELVNRRWLIWRWQHFQIKHQNSGVQKDRMLGSRWSKTMLKHLHTYKDQVDYRRLQQMLLQWHVLVRQSRLITAVTARTVIVKTTILNRQAWKM